MREWLSVSHPTRSAMRVVSRLILFPLRFAFAIATLATAFAAAAPADAISLARSAQSSAPHASTGAYTLYVSNEASDDVTVIDGATLTARASFSVGKRPRGIHASADGSTLFVATSGSPRLGPGADPERAKAARADRAADGIAIVELATQRVLRRLQVGSDPEQFILLDHDQRVIVANEDEGTATGWDVRTGRRVFSATVTEEPEGVALHPNGREVYVTCEQRGDVFVLDAASGAEIARFRVRGRPRTVAFTPDGARAFVPAEGEAEVTVIDAKRHAIVSALHIEGADMLPMGAVCSPDGREVYVSTGRGQHVAVIDAAALRVSALIRVGERPWGIALSPDGSRLFTANGLSDDVSVVDVPARREIARVKTGRRPWGIAVSAALSPKAQP